MVFQFKCHLEEFRGNRLKCVVKFKINLLNVKHGVTVACAMLILLKGECVNIVSFPLLNVCAFLEPHWQLGLLVN